MITTILEIFEAIHLDLVFRYWIAPGLIGLFYGTVQKYLFLRNDRRAAGWWPWVTAIGAMAGALVGIILFFLLAFILSSVGIEHVVGEGILFLIFFEGSFGMIGVICSLMQFGFLSGIKPRAYLKGAWIISAIAGLAASGAMDIIARLTPPIEYSIAAEGHMISFTLPMMIMTSIFVYGIGTSIVLFLLNKNKGLKHEK